MRGGLPAAVLARAYERGRKHISREVAKGAKSRLEARETDLSMTLLESIRAEHFKCAWRFLEIGERTCAARHIRAAIIARQQIEKLEGCASSRPKQGYDVACPSIIDI